jgi:hypothetical protein
MRRFPALILLSAGLSAFAGRVTGAPPKPLPSLATINALLDRARDLERRKDYASVPSLYAQVLAEAGDPPPRHLIHVVAKALVHTGHANLALGDIPGSASAYRQALDRFGASYDAATRTQILRAQVLLGRVEEILRTLPDGTPVATAPPPPPPAGASPPPGKEPLLLLTDRTDPDREGHDPAKGFEVRSFDGDEASLIRDAERNATPAGRRILETGRRMATETRDILPGSCWDWVHAVFDRAGFPMKKRDRVFKSAKKGPYADAKLLRPGDWMYDRNRSYGNIEHSGIFVGWINAPDRIALVLSYPGMQRREPGRYRPYDLTGVWTIFRPAG